MNVEQFKRKLRRECDACDKPFNCWIGCKVTFSVKALRAMLGDGG